MMSSNPASASWRRCRCFPDAFRLLHDIARVYDLAFVVDTCSPGNKDLFPVAIGYGCPPLEGHPVFVCRIQVGGSIEELDLSGLQAFYGIGIHLDKNVRIGMAPLYSRTGDIMGLFRQVLREENLFAGFDDAGIVDIHVLDEEPGTDAIVCQFTSLLGQLQDVIVQQKPGLVLGVGCPVARAAGPVLRIMVMFGFRHSVFDRFDGDTGLEPSPHGYFAPVQRSLLHNEKRAIGIFAFPSHHQVGLVGCVAQEIAAEDGGRIVGQRLLDNCRVGPLDILKLSGKRQSPVRNSKQDVIFGNPAFPGKVEF